MPLSSGAKGRGVRVSRVVVGAGLFALFAATGCSRLTFIKQDMTRGDFDRTARELDMETDPLDSGRSVARVAVQRGQQFLAAGDLDKADQSARKALKADGKSPNANALMALVADRRGDQATAGKYYREAVDLAPTQGVMLNNYGTWLCQNGRASESLEWFGKALSDPRYPTPAAAMANAGACADAAGDDSLAEQYLRAAIEIDPANPVALMAMAEREFRGGRNMQARAFIERRLAAARVTPDTLRLASQIEQRLGDTDAAAKYGQRLRAEFPESSGSVKGKDGR